jgi:trans-aconitate methyltransferase
VNPKDIFWSEHYLRHTQRRQEHLASLGLALSRQRVLEVGAGIGDHTSFFLDRECEVIVSEAQEQNLAVLRERYPDLDTRQLDLNDPPAQPIAVDVVYCYGVLYHLERPASALAWMSSCAQNMLLLETCVSAAEHDTVYPFFETAEDPENAVSGRGCRPTRSWVRRELASHFPHVYATVTQPWHAEFPLDWSAPELADNSLIRAVYVASRQPLANPQLTEALPTKHLRDAAEHSSAQA